MLLIYVYSVILQLFSLSQVTALGALIIAKNMLINLIGKKCVLGGACKDLYVLLIVSHSFRLKKLWTVKSGG